MRKIVFLFGLLGLVSCDPDDETIYSNNVELTQDTTYVNPLDYLYDGNYYYEGVLPDWGTSFGVNDLVNTKWLITRVYNGYTLTFPNDTLTFISGTEYRINSLPNRTYTFSGITGSTNKSLGLNHFMTLGGSNYTGQVGAFFIQDGMINGSEFHDNQNQSMVYKVWMEKI